MQDRHRVFEWSLLGQVPATAAKVDVMQTCLLDCSLRDSTQARLLTRSVRSGCSRGRDEVDTAYCGRAFTVTSLGNNKNVTNQGSTRIETSCTG